MNEIVQLGASEARLLTDEIKRTAEKLYELFMQAYEGQAWKALGYDSWRRYISQEFGMSERHAYRLLDQARIVRVIEDHLTDPSNDLDIPIPNSNYQVESLAPIMKQDGPENMVRVWEKANEIRPNPPARIIKEVREREEAIEAWKSDPDSIYNTKAQKDPDIEQSRKAFEFRSKVETLRRRVESIGRLYDRYVIDENDKEYFIERLDLLISKLEILKDLIATSSNMDDKLKAFFDE